MADRDDDMSFWRAGDRGAWRDDNRYGPRSDPERRSFGSEGEREPSRRDRYGSRFDQDRAEYGSGYDASRGGYGAGAEHHAYDPDYLHWRETQMRTHDRDYRDWREAQHRQYDDEYHQFRTERRNHFGHNFHQWRAQRNMTGGMVATDISPGGGGYAGKTAHAGGLYADQDRPSGSYEPRSTHQTHDHAGGDHIATTGSEFGKEPPAVQAATDGDRKTDRK